MGNNTLTPEQIEIVKELSTRSDLSDKQKAIVSELNSRIAPPKTSARQYVSAVARPVLTGGGAMAGGVVGSGLGPVGAAAGGVLGYGTGKAAADLLDRSLGLKKPISNIPEAVKETGSNVYEGAQSEAMGMMMPAAYNSVVKPAFKGLGRQLEQLSGIAPRAEGVLERAAGDATLMSAPGRKIVQKSYEEAKGGNVVSTELSKIADKKRFINKARNMADSGALDPVSALDARKELDRIKNNVTDSFYRVARNKFDSIAKKLFKDSDVAYQRAVDAEALRNFLPQNKYGGASAFKMGIITALRNTPVLGVAMSPAAQGIGATGIGLANRYALNPVLNNPNSARGLSALLLSAIKQNRKNNEPVR